MWVPRGALIYEIDIGVAHWFSHSGASSERKIEENHWIREAKRWHFGSKLSMHFFSLIEAPNISEFLTCKRMIMHRIILNNWFAVGIEKFLALGDRLKEKKKGVTEWEPSIFKKKNMWSLGDGYDENGGLNRPTFAAPPKRESVPQPGYKAQDYSLHFHTGKQ